MRQRNSIFELSNRWRLKWWSIQLTTLSLVFLGLSYSTYRSLYPSDLKLRRVDWPSQSQWIAAEGANNYSSFFRKQLTLSEPVVNAWIKIAPSESYELIINGNYVSRWDLWRPTRCFQTGMSEFGQRIQRDRPTMALNFPREFQWTGHRNAALPVFVNITKYFRRGLNVICLEVKSRKSPACVRFSGWIETASGKRIPICSDTSFKACQAPRGVFHANWCSYNFLKLDWSDAVVVPGSKGLQWAHVPGNAFSDRFRGNWIFSPQRFDSHADESGESRSPVSYFYRSHWNLPAAPDQAYIRVLSTRPFYVFVNGDLVDPNLPYAKGRTGSEWLINAKIPTPRARPELLDPDEVGNIFVGTRFESPRNGDPTVNDFHRDENTLNRTQDRPLSQVKRNADDTDSKTRTKSLAEILSPQIESPDRMVPKSLTRNVESVDFKIYGIANLLRPGDNTLTIRAVDDPVRDARRLGAPRIAVDMGAKIGQQDHHFQSGAGWEIDVDIDDSLRVPASTYVRPTKLPQLQFWGHAGVPLRKRVTYGGQAVVLAATIIALWWAAVSVYGLRPLFIVYHWIPSLVVLFAAVAIELTVAENHEIVYFMMRETWLTVTTTAVLLPAFGAMRMVICRSPRWIRVTESLGTPLRKLQVHWQRRTSQRRNAVVKSRRRQATQRWLNRRSKRFSRRRADRRLAPSSRWWAVLVVLMIIACGWVRAYELDFQTLDDDEYASVQAALAIADHGTPHFVGNIYYSRSPLHHYYAGALAWMFGGNIWVLRMGQVVLAMGTCLMTYLTASQILRSRWVGIGSMLVFTVHPFLLFSAHVARFYQQQQFFALLVVYWFYWGFVAKGYPKYRYWCLAAFLGALLSQETSAVLGLSMGICFLAFTKNIKTSGILKCGVVAACVVSLLIVDFVAFQANCLTRTEGVSPNVEAAVKPNITNILNCLSLFITYARLHIVLSIFVVIGLVAALYEKNRDTIYLGTMCVTGVVFAVTFVTGVSLRYQFWVFAPWIVMSVHGIQKVSQIVGRSFRIPRYSLASPSVVAVSLTLVVVASFCPWRIAGSYDTKILGNATGALRWVRANMRPGDAVGTTEPHPHCAKIEAGESTFDISFPLLYDFTYKDPQGYLRDRNANALVLSNIASLQWAIANYDRIWFCVNREKFRSCDRNLKWEYPSARAELFLRQNCELARQDYLWSVYLWDKNRGHLSAFRRELP